LIASIAFLVNRGIVGVASQSKVQRGVRGLGSIWEANKGDHGTTPAIGESARDA